MKFSTHGGEVWLLSELSEYSGDKKSAEAWITDVEVN